MSVAAIVLNFSVCVDTTLYEALFQSCATGNVDEVKSHLELAEQKSLHLPLQPLATLAAHKGRPEVLRLCFDRGAHLDPDIKRAAELAAPNEAVDSIVAEHKIPEDMMEEPVTSRPTNCYSPQQLAEKFDWIDW